MALSVVYYTSGFPLYACRSAGHLPADVSLYIRRLAIRLDLRIAHSNSLHAGVNLRPSSMASLMLLTSVVPSEQRQALIRMNEVVGAAHLVKSTSILGMQVSLDPLRQYAHPGLHTLTAYHHSLL